MDASLRLNGLVAGLVKASLLGVVFTLAACGSSVKLDEATVQDRTAVVVSRDAALGQQGATNSAGSRDVSGVDIEQKNTAGLPADLQKIIYFDYDSYEVRSEYSSLLQAHARFLAANSGLKLGLEGHTDERGGREYNLALGQKRSESVRRALALLGVKEAQMEAVSFGEEKPQVEGASEDSHGRNRRVEFNLR